jgi:hypothetical protein
MSGLGIAGQGRSQAEISEILPLIRRLTSQLTIQEQWVVIYHLIRERLGADPQQGSALTDENGQTYLFLVPPHLMDRPHDDEAKVAASLGTRVPADRFLEVISQTDDLEAVARRLCDLGGVSR